MQVLATPFGQAIAPMLTGMEARLNTPMAQQVLAVTYRCPLMLSLTPACVWQKHICACISLHASLLGHAAQLKRRELSETVSHSVPCCSMQSRGHIHSHRS